MLVDFKYVLALGTGLYSALTFLDRRVLPNLVQLDSVENNAGWACRVSTVTQNDARHRMFITGRAVADYLPEIPMDRYDLIFIDDSIASEDRARTIHSVMRARSRTSVVVIHDFEVPQYRRAANGPKERFVFDAFIPHVGILWDGGTLAKPQLRELRNQVSAAANTSNAADRDSWLSTLSCRIAPQG